MLILALESSAKAASAALARDGELLELAFRNDGLTHSRTLLPMAEELLKAQDENRILQQRMEALAKKNGPTSTEE